jgi:Nucleotidyltransferase/DNA polymerase involved in DNA repair
MGEPAFKMKEIIEKNGIAVFSSNYTLYGDMSHRVMTTLAEFVPKLEIYSIDESFLDYSGLVHINLFDYSKKVRKTVIQNTGIPVSIGIANTKTLAKVANKKAKKSEEGVFIIDEVNRMEVLNSFPIEDVWGIGFRYAAFLKRYGINTAGDFIKMPGTWVKKNMSVVGLRTQKELMGVSCIPMELMPPSKKGICTSRSFGEMISDEGMVREAASSFAVRCAYKLRKQKSAANLLTVFLQTNFFRKQDKQYSASKVIKLPTETNSSIEIVKYALAGLSSIYKPGYNYKRVGVMVMGIVPVSQVQGSLFDTVDREKHKRLMKAVDNLNDSYGRDKLRLAVQGTGRKWKLKQERLSPCYTTRLNDIITVNI